MISAMLADRLGFLANAAPSTMIILLLIVAAVLLFVEVCTPSFGVFGFLALAAVVGAVIYAFKVNNLTGFSVLLGSLVATPIYLYFMVKLLPKTPVGKLLFLKKAPDATNDAAPESQELAGLVGKSGTAVTLMRPAGTVLVEGRRYVGRANMGMIEKDAKIKVIRACGSDVIVALADDE